MDFSHRQLSQDGIPTIDRTRLLVSVQSLEEARMVIAAQVDWIDVKNPRSGSLGAPALATLNQIAPLLKHAPRRSLALGELREVDRALAARLSKGFPVAKVGLSYMAAQANLATQFRELAALVQPAQLVPVLYADHARCGAPTFPCVLELARRVGSKFVLIDTYFKDGLRLPDYFNCVQLSEAIAAARQLGIGVVLAGSLQAADLPGLMALQPAAIAVRGAVCAGERTGSMCAQRLRWWASEFDRR